MYTGLYQSVIGLCDNSFECFIFMLRQFASSEVHTQDLDVFYYSVVCRSQRRVHTDSNTSPSVSERHESKHKQKRITFWGLEFGMNFLRQRYISLPNIPMCHARLWDDSFCVECGSI